LRDTDGVLAVSQEPGTRHRPVGRRVHRHTILVRRSGRRLRVVVSAVARAADLSPQSVRAPAPGNTEGNRLAGAHAPGAGPARARLVNASGRGYGRAHALSRRIFLSIRPILMRPSIRGKALLSPPRTGTIGIPRPLRTTATSAPSAGRF